MSGARLVPWRGSRRRRSSGSRRRPTSSRSSRRIRTCAARASGFTGLCPFHDERTPSFSVNPAEKLYHCFGCGVGGDVFTFVEEKEGLAFGEAVEALAERYGVEVEREQEDPRAEEARKRRARLAELLERTAAFYATYLWESDEAGKAREYLRGRGLGEEVLREFGVGFAPSAWDTVLHAGAAGRGSRIAELVRGRAAGEEGQARAATTTTSARGSCSRSAMRAGGCRGSAARAMREDQRAEVPELAGGRAVSKEPHALRDRPGAAGDREGGAGGGGRGVHGRDRGASGGDRGDGRGDGHGDHARAGEAARRARGGGGAGAGRGPRRGGRRCCARSGWRPASGCACGSRRCRRARTRPTCWRAKRPESSVRTRFRALVDGGGRPAGVPRADAAGRGRSALAGGTGPGARRGGAGARGDAATRSRGRS